MIIIDTSIWIDFFKNSLSQDEEFSFFRFLKAEKIISPEIVFAELLQGVKNNTEKVIIMKYSELINSCASQNWLKIGVFSYENKLIHNGVGIIDSFLLYAAKKEKVSLWTRDKKLIRMAEKIGISLY